MITVPTQRFGVIQRPIEEVLTFPSGIFGFELQLHWLLLGDRAHGALYWLQNVENTDLSMPIVDPREFVHDYKLQIKRSNLGSLWSGTEQLLVFSVVTEYEGQLCMNLRNPILVNPDLRVGGQVVTTDGRSFQYALPGQTLPLRKSA